MKKEQNKKAQKHIDSILKQIKKINSDLKELKESSESEYVNEGIINQVRIRIEELELKKHLLEDKLDQFDY